MYQIFLSDYFLRQIKPHLKKFRNLEKDLAIFLENFNSASVDSLGHKLYKARLKSSDVPKGKSKSFRVIVFLMTSKEVIAPITLYFKSQNSDISQKELESHLEMVLAEIRKRRKI